MQAVISPYSFYSAQRTNFSLLLDFLRGEVLKLATIWSNNLKSKTMSAPHLMFGRKDFAVKFLNCALQYLNSQMCIHCIIVIFNEVLSVTALKKHCTSTPQMHHIQIKHCWLIFQC